MRLSLTILTNFIFLQFFIFGGTIRHDVEDAKYIELGQEENYKSVGLVRFTSKGKKKKGSGVLIHKDWVLTAAHNVDAKDLSDLFFKIENKIYKADLSKIFYHEKWNIKKLWNGYDIALFKLQKPIADIAPAEIYKGSDEVNEVGIFVGYGKGGTGLTGQTGIGGRQKRAGKNAIDESAGIRDSRNFRNLLVADFDHPEDSK